MVTNRNVGIWVPTVLIACSAKKRTDLAVTTARQLYQGDLFKKSVAWAEAHGLPWLVLSAYYGVLKPDDAVGPYDVTLQKMSKYDRGVWNRQVTNQLREGGYKGPFIILAGALYRGWAIDRLDVEVPMRGLGIGEQKKWLKDRT
jgi:hypothetical protein